MYVITTEQGEKTDGSATDRSSDSKKDNINFNLFNALSKDRDYTYKESITKTSIDPNKILKSEIMVDIKKGGATNIKLNAEKVDDERRQISNPGSSVGSRYPSSTRSKCTPKIPARQNNSDLQPKLITTQNYCIKDHPKTCIRRYVFEIPINQDCDCPEAKGNKKTLKGN